MFYHVFDKQDKIREIYFLRQLQHDEAEKKVVAHQCCSAVDVAREWVALLVASLLQACCP